MESIGVRYDWHGYAEKSGQRKTATVYETVAVPLYMILESIIRSGCDYPEVPKSYALLEREAASALEYHRYAISGEAHTS